MNQDLANVPLEDLPASVRELAGVVGLPAVLRLVERWGGVTRLYVPQTLDEGHDLAQLLGLTPARALAREYGGDYVTVPRCAAALRLARDRALLRRRAEGVAPRRLALVFNLTERHVWRILRQAAEQRPAQGRLPGC